MKDYDKSLIKTRNAQKLLYESYNIDKIAKRFALQIKNCFKE
jgi:transposase